jgi:hypothetical protein
MGSSPIAEAYNMRGYMGQSKDHCVTSFPHTLLPLRENSTENARLKLFIVFIVLICNWRFWWNYARRSDNAILIFVGRWENHFYEQQVDQPNRAVG